MKKFIFVLLAVSFNCHPLFAADQAALESRIAQSIDVLGQIMQSPDQSIPEELLAKCKAIAIYPRVIKGAFIFGGRFGQGVVLKHNDKTGEWVGPAFSTIGGGNWGFQIGGQATDLILVIMNENGLNSLLNSKFTLGADASIAAGPIGRTSSGGTDLTLQASIVTYSRSYGLFAGVSLDGAVVTQDNNSNSLYYGKSVSSSEILNGQAGAPPSSASKLIDALNDYSKRWYQNPRSINRDLPRIKEYDYEGEIEAIDYKSGEITLIDLRPVDKRPADAPATKTVLVSQNEIAPFKIKDRVKIIFKNKGKNNEVQTIVKV